MSLDGLRAWIGEVERKLDARTRVFLVLAAIAVGGAAAGVYLGVEAQNNEVSESDVQALQDRLEEQISGGGAADVAALTELEADLKELEAEVEQLRGDDEASGKGKSGSDGGGGADSGGTSGGAKDTTSGTAGGDETATGGSAESGEETSDKLREVIEKAKEASEKAQEAK